MIRDGPDGILYTLNGSLINKNPNFVMRRMIVRLNAALWKQAIIILV